MVYSYIFLVFLLVSVNGQSCVSEKGEWTFSDKCYCETNYSRLGVTSAKEFRDDVKIGFVADTGYGSSAKRVLELLRNEGVNAVVHSGDLDYVDSSQTMENLIESVFPSDFPYFYTIGNHDVVDWAGYQTKNINRLRRVSNLYCEGIIGVKSSCYFKGVQIVSTGTGTLCDNHHQFLHTELNTDARWKVCSFHRVHADFQLGSKPSEVLLDIYQECINNGALVISGHDHVYGRTFLISDVVNKVVHKSLPYKLMKKGLNVFGRGMIWINGVGGNTLYSEKNNNGNKGWWEKALTRVNGVNYGGLICTFKIESVNCYFKTIDNVVLDSVLLESEIVAPSECVPSCPECTKSWLTPVYNGCGGVCPMDNCLANERCSSGVGYKCVRDDNCLAKCNEVACVNPGQNQPTNWCGGTCNVPLC